MNWQNIKNQMTEFLKTELRERNMSKVVVGLSGGLDSAIVATLCQEVFQDKLLVVLLPSQYSSQSSIDDALQLCQDFNIKYKIIEIEPILEGYFSSNSDATPLQIGNFSARIRMSVLYDISAKENALVIGTSNKSEILLGYGTIYGDTACAINPIGQLYKSDAFDFAIFLGITQAIIDKKPSADLWDGQNDEDELGYTYQIMDNVLKELIDNNKSKEQLLNQNIDEDLIDMLLHRIKANQFKNKLPTIAKINFKG